MNLNEHNLFKVYIKTFSISFCVFSVFPLLGFFYVLRIHEHDPFSEIVSIQKNEGAIYGTALNPNDLKYKLELYRSRKTDFVVLGSSRSMKFRSEFFYEPITNLGGTFSTLSEGQEFIQWILQEKTPKSVMLVVDYWWFHSEYSYDERRRFVSETAVNQDKLLKPWAWMFEQKIRVGEFLRTLLFGESSNPYSSVKSLGLRAIKYSSGFRYDGSYMEVDLDSGAPDRRMESMKSELREIHEGKNLRAELGYGDFVDEVRWKQFVTILAELREKSELIVVLPPVAPMLSLDMENNPQRRFARQLQRKLRELSVSVIDFTDFRTYTRSDSEFLDLWHPGEVAAVRQLVEIKKSFPNSLLASNINEKACQVVIDKESGKGIISLDLRSESSGEK